MLSTIGRAAARKVGGSTRSINRALQSIWQLNRVTPLQSSDNPSAQYQLSCLFNRAYATAAKATTKSRAKPKTTATKSKTKPSLKAKTATKSKVGKAVKKPVKKTPVKKKVTGRPKKPLTEEEKLKKLVKELKAKALLDAPSSKPSTAWLVLQGERSKLGGGNVVSVAAASSVVYKNLTPAELESYNHTANQNKRENEAAYKKWVESHTPDEIRVANNARKLLKRKLDLKQSRKYPVIADPRLPKKPIGTCAFYTKARFASGDFKGLSLTDATTLIFKEYKELSPSEKKQYEDEAAADLRRYRAEVKTVFGVDLPVKA